MERYQKPGMEEQQVQHILSAFAKGENLKGERAAGQLLAKGQTFLLKARGESLLASSLFAKGAYEQLKKLPLAHQTKKEQEAISHLLPFYTNHLVKKGRMKKIQGENLLPKLLFFPAEVEGKKGQFLFDTGAMGTIIREGFLPQPGEKHQGIKALNAFGEELEDNHLRVVKTLGFAGLRFINKLCMVLPAKHLTFPLSAHNQITIDGIIGFDIIKDFAWRINTLKGTIQRIASVKGSSPPILYCDFFPLIKLIWNGAVQLFAFDTGANQSVMFHSPNNQEMVPLGQDRLFAAGGEGRGFSGWLENQEVFIGPRFQTGVKAALMENKVNISYHFNPAGILGMDLLSGESLEIDFPGQRLLLK